MNSMKILVDSAELQQKILDCILSGEVDNFFNATIFASDLNADELKRAMIHGMVIAGMLTCRCKYFYVEEVKKE